MNKLDQLAKEKYNGDLRAAWGYVLYEASQEERQEYMEYVSKKQLDIGMTALKRGAPNELDALANSKFNGDMKKTWDYIFSNCSPEEIERYTSMANPYQAGQAILLVDGLKDSRTRKGVRKIEKVEKYLRVLKLSCEDVRNAQKNPYKIPMLKSILQVILVFAAVIGLTVYKIYMSPDEDVVNAVTGVLCVICFYCVYRLVYKIRDYFRYRYVKKALESDHKGAIEEYIKMTHGM